MTNGTYTAPAPAGAEDWVSAFFRTADACDADALAACFAERIDMRFANNPPATTREEARDGLRAFLTHLTGMRHEAHARFTDGEGVVQLATVTYILPGGREVPLPVASHLRRNEAALIDRLWIYIDLAPLFAHP